MSLPPSLACEAAHGEEAPRGTAAWPGVEGSPASDETAARAGPGVDSTLMPGAGGICWKGWRHEHQAGLAYLFMAVPGAQDPGGSAKTVDE